jgi:hypothetical protein
MSAVKSQIVAAARARLEALDGVGVVLEPGQRADGSAIASALAAGDYAIEIGIGEDDVGEADLGSIEHKTFSLVVYAHMPESGSPPTPPSEVAGDVYAAVIAAFVGTVNGGADETFGGLALRCDDAGGGGVGFDPELDTLVTAVNLDITYRHARGDAQTPR